eukprot:jgi/Picsp_1/920/NSC_04405-R1_protein
MKILAMQCSPFAYGRSQFKPSTKLSTQNAHWKYSNPPSQRRLALAYSSASAAPEQMDPADEEAWTACSNILEDLGMSGEDAAAALKRGFGWASQAYWRQEKVNESPSSEVIACALEFLESIGLENNDDKVEVIKKFPEVLSVDARLMKENVSKLEKSFFMKGKQLAAAVKRKPRVLGATVDCLGDCAGECTRCFAQF